MTEFFGQFPATPQPWSHPGFVRALYRRPRGLLLSCGVPYLTVSVLASNLIRVRLSPNGSALGQRSWAVTRQDEDWPLVPFQIEQTEAEVVLHTDEMQVVIERDPMSLRCLDAAGRAFAVDHSMGWRPSTPSDQAGIDQVALWKRLDPAEHCYGLGEKTGQLDRRGRSFTHWTQDVWNHSPITDEIYVAIPFVLMVRPGLAYGILIHCSHKSYFRLGSGNSDIAEFAADAPELDYYILFGPDPARVLRTYADLTGHMPLPPLWSLGYQQCRWSYNSEAKLQQIAAEFRQRRIPCDALYLDIDYMRGYRLFTWDPKRFPDPARLVSDLAKQGFKTIPIVDPGIKFDPEADYAPFDQGMAGNYFVRQRHGALFAGYVWPGKTVFPDFMRADVRQWWGDLHRDLVEVGMAGIWNDMNEPSVSEVPNGSQIPFPLDAPQGAGPDLTSHAETHNLYGSMMARSCAEGLRRLRPEERSFVLTRSGFAGIQRWSAVWTGDNYSHWEYLQMSLPMLCNLGLSGVPFVGADIGGFFGDATPELYARWIQVGMLYPLMRGHTSMGSIPHEPWAFGSEVEEIARRYIELRYRLLPYLYTLFWQAATTGCPILRPLLYEFPDDEQTYHLADQVLLGSALLAAPVLQPGSRHRSVYLPAGTWYDWWTDERFSGPTHILAEAPLDRLPLYVRAGSVVPLAPVAQYVGEQAWDPLTIKVWPGDGGGIFYEDDGHSYDHERGRWATTTYRVSQSGSGLEIGARQGDWIPPERQVLVEVVGYGSRAFVDDGQERQFRWDG